MKATKANFTRKMESLETAGIVELIQATWNDATGGLFREIGFDIIEAREGEAESDRLYAEIFAACN